jgi:hypothetical protein
LGRKCRGVVLWLLTRMRRRIVHGSLGLVLMGWIGDDVVGGGRGRAVGVAIWCV